MAKKRPADVIGGAVKVMQLATGQEEEDRESEKAGECAGGLGSEEQG